MSFRPHRPLSRLFGLLGLAVVALAPACDDVVAGRAVTPPPPAPGPTAPLRVVNLLVGAPSVDLALDGAPTWSDVAWPAVTTSARAPVGGAVTASVDGEVVASATPALEPSPEPSPDASNDPERAPDGARMLALMGFVGGPQRALTLAPSPEARPRLRVVLASPVLHDGTVMVSCGSVWQSLPLAYGDVTAWVDLRSDQVDDSFYLGFDSDLRHVWVPLHGRITEPTTLYLTATADEEVVVLAVADSGLASVTQPDVSRPRLRLLDFARPSGAVTIAFEGAAGALAPRTLGWGDSTALEAVETGLATLRATAEDGAVLASASYELEKFADVSFVLVGADRELALLPLFDGWSHLLPPTGRAELRLIDGLASGGPLAASWTPAYGAPAWQAAGGPIGRDSAGDVFAVTDDRVVIALDLDGDGAPDLRFPLDGAFARAHTNLVVARDGDGAAWLYAQQDGGGVVPYLAAEETAHLRAWNLGADAVAFAGPRAPLWDAWLASLAPGQASVRLPLRRGPGQVELGSGALALPLDAASDSTVIAAPDGRLVVVTSPSQVVDRHPAVRLVNLSDETITAALGSTPLGGALAPRGQSPEVDLAPAPGAAGPTGPGTLVITRADGSALTFALDPLYPDAATILVYGGDPSWPTLQTLPPWSAPTVAHPRELSASLRVVAALTEWQPLDLYLDGAATPLVALWPQWSQSPRVAFAVTPDVTVPIGPHALALGEGDAAIAVPLALAAESATTLVVLPDLTTRLVPSPADDEVVVVNTTAPGSTTGVVLVDHQGAPLGTLVGNLAFGGWATSQYPGGGVFAAVDWDGDGAPDWQSDLPVLSGSFVLVVGGGDDQAVVCLRGGWGGIRGHRVAE